MLVSYAEKRCKEKDEHGFFLFSTTHDEMRVSKDQQAKSQPKFYYDHMKDGVDAVDLMSAMASKQKKNK